MDANCEVLASVDGRIVFIPDALGPSLHAGPRARTLTGSRVAAAVLVTSVSLALIAGLISVPYVSSTGAVLAADEMVSAPGRLDEPAGGRVVVPVVNTKPVSLFGALGGWLESRTDVSRGRPSADEIRAHRRLMSEAGEVAGALALGHLGLDAGATAVAVEAHGLGGPSAGLAFALEMFDQLSSGDLTNGQTVAVTGAVDPAGQVTGVGGIKHKVEAARRAGADLLIVPVDNYAEVYLSEPGLDVVGVATFADALAAVDAL